MKVSIYFAKTFKDASAAIMQAVAGGSASPENKKFLLVPDKLTLSAETEVLYAARGKGTFNVFVYSFTRLCSALARGKEKGKYLNKLSSVELFARIINENKEQLKYFGTAAHRTGFAEMIYETVSKLRYCLISPSDLMRFGGAGQLKAKTEDIAFLYEKYNDYIKDRFYDSSTKLDILYNLLDEGDSGGQGRPPLQGTHIFLKDYDNFSRQETKIIKKMMQSAASVSVACTRDDTNPYLYKNEIFDTLVGSCADLGITPQLIDANGQPDKILAKVQSDLFSFKPIKPIDSEGRVSLCTAADAFDEAEKAARYISAAVRQGARYRDFTVVTASLADYRPPLARAFDKYDIPCFLDQGTTLSNHSLGRFILSVLEAKTEGLSAKLGIKIVKNFFGDPENADALENFCLKYAIKSMEKEWTHGKYFERANEARKKLLQILTAFSVPRLGAADAFVNAVREFLVEIDAQKRLAVLAESEAAAGAEVLGRVSEQIFDKIEETLQSIETVLGGYFISDKEFIRILSSGFEAQNISVVPMNLDAVYAGELTTSKYHAVKNLIVLGCIDGVIPGEEKDTGLFSEKNIRDLTAVGIGVEPGIAAENAKNKFNVYQLMQEPTGNIYLSFPSASFSGQKNKESRLFLDFERMFLTEKVRSGGADSKDFESQIFTRSQAELMLKKGAEKTDKNINALFYALGEHAFESVPQEETVNAQGLYGKKLSCSKIETFFDCPFKHFLSYGLGLRQRELPDIMPFDTGTILHAVAEGFLKRPKIDAGEIKHVAAELLDAELSKDAYKKFRSAASFVALSKRLHEEAESLCEQIFEGVNSADFAPDTELLEYHFESDDLTGFIDRIDTSEEYVRVIDYKTGNVDAGFKDVYRGRKLQLFIYLIEAVKKTGKLPAGAYYFPIKNDFEAADGKPSPRLVGYTLGEVSAVRAADKNLAVGVPSKEIGARLIDKGSERIVASVFNDKILSGQQMQAMIDYAGTLVQNAKRDILSGYIKPSPFKPSATDSVCDFCDYDAVCKNKNKSERMLPPLYKKHFTEGGN